MKSGQHIGQFGAVLRTDPIEFETIGHKQSDLGKVIRNLRSQGLDPGVELLLREFLRQLVEADLPERLACVVRVGWVLSTAHCNAPLLWTVWRFMQLKSNFIKSLSTCQRWGFRGS